MAEDSGGAGRLRGGCGTVWEVEPLDHTMTVVAFGEGRHIPTMGAGGAEQISPELKLGKLEVFREGGQTDLHLHNTVIEIKAGERARNTNPGGGGFGSSFEREPEAVLRDVIEGIVSINAAAKEYGVVIDSETLQLDEKATKALRAEAA